MKCLLISCLAGSRHQTTGLAFFFAGDPSQTCCNAGTLLTAELALQHKLVCNRSGSMHQAHAFMCLSVCSSATIHRWKCTKLRRLGVCRMTCCILAAAVVSAQQTAGYLRCAFILMTAEQKIQHLLSLYNISGNTRQAFVLMCSSICECRTSTDSRRGNAALPFCDTSGSTHQPFVPVCLFACYDAAAAQVLC